MRVSFLNFRWAIPRVLSFILDYFFSIEINFGSVFFIGANDIRLKYQLFQIEIESVGLKKLLQFKKAEISVRNVKITLKNSEVTDNEIDKGFAYKIEINEVSVGLKKLLQFKKTEVLVQNVKITLNHSEVTDNKTDNGIAYKIPEILFTLFEVSTFRVIYLSCFSFFSLFLQ